MPIEGKPRSEDIVIRTAAGQKVRKSNNYIGHVLFLFKNVFPKMGKNLLEVEGRLWSLFTNSQRVCLRLCVSRAPRKAILIFPTIYGTTMQPALHRN